jgi:DNA-binding transcriptional LysR family regulator
MRDFHDLIHSPHHLLVFEAAARHSSFTRAAAELNVSQPAVSVSIRQLETTLGARLFSRGHRSVSLTEAGEMLYHDVSTGFSRILETARLLRRQGHQGHVTLSVSTAFAAYWMVPRLETFHRDHRSIDLRLQTTDKELDLAQEGVSLGVRRGDGNWRGYSAELIAEEVLAPIASPQFVAAHGEITSVEDLAARRLIHLEEPYRPRPTWTDWFAAMDFAFRDTGLGLRLNDYALVIQAAMAGEGIAMGWEHVTSRLIEQGLLVRAGPWQWRTSEGFYLIWSRETQLSPQAEIVREWIIDSAKSSLPATA